MKLHEAWQRLIERGFAEVLVAGPATLAASAYTIRTRNLHDVLVGSAITGVPLCVFAYLVIVAAAWQGGSRRAGRLLAALVGAPVAMMAVGFVYYAVFAAGKDLFIWSVTSHNEPRDTLVVFLAILALVAGGALFFFRLHFRSLYGVTEVGIGMLVSAQHVPKDGGLPGASEQQFYVAILTAAVYLVVRGLDNVHQGLIKSPPDRVARWICDQAGITLPAPK